MKLLIPILFFLGLSLAAHTQELVPNDTINQVDQQNRKQGFWYYKNHKSLDDMFPYSEYGYYKDDRKTGPWVKLDTYGRLKSIESYFKGILNGKVQYFDKGQLNVEGNFRALDPDKEKDTIIVLDPSSEMEEETIIMPSDIGSVKHGEWKYYDPRTGALLKIEEYQVDKLIRTQELYVDGYATSDSAYKKKIENKMPHKQDPSGRKYQKGKIRKSLTE